MPIRVRTSARDSDSAAGHAAAKLALAALFSVGAGRIVLVPRRHAPPAPWIRDRAGRFRRATAALSLAHRDGRAIAAASRSRIALGADLEPAGAIDPAHARYFLTRRERTAPNAPGLTERWVLKEAAWKALRCASDTPFAAIELAFNDAGALCGITLRGVQRPARARLLHPWPGYVAAVVATRSTE